MMLRVILLILCLVATSMAGTIDVIKKKPRKEYRFLDDIYPYFDVSIGAMYSSFKYETASRNGFYYDKKNEEMIYSKSLLYDIYSSEGWGPLIDTRAGILVVRRIALFIDIGAFWTVGTYDYSYYSMGGESFSEEDTRLRLLLGIGFRIYPFTTMGFFVGSSYEIISLYGDGEAWKKYGMAYSSAERGLTFEIGDSWKVSKHYSVGLAMNFMLGMNGSCRESDELKVGRNPGRADDIVFNSGHVGFVLMITRM